MGVTDDDWDLLNAYADGELDRVTAKAIAARLANEPALQATHERILTIKASLRQMHPVPGSTKPTSRSTKARRRVLAAAVTLLVVVGAVASGIFLRQGAERNLSIAELHRQFSDRSYVIDTSTRVDVSAGTTIGSLSAPDLSPSNLTLVDVEVMRSGVHERIAMHYRGRRGCRVTLVADALAVAATPDLSIMGLSYQWQTSRVRFYLVADGMDPARFAAIAAFAEATSHQADDEDMFRTALVERTAAARPCA